MMDTFETVFEKNIRKKLETVFADKSPEIKEIMRLELTDATEEEKQKTIENIRKRNERDLMLMQSNTYTYYNSDGKLVPFDWISSKDTITEPQ